LPRIRHRYLGPARTSISKIPPWPAVPLAGPCGAADTRAAPAFLGLRRYADIVPGNSLPRKKPGRDPLLGYRHP
jgi:hypothetical protein